MAVKKQRTLGYTLTPETEALLDKMAALEAGLGQLGERREFHSSGMVDPLSLR
jgi:hypothetical protein